MKSISAVPGVKVSADGRGVVSHAGMGLLRELADLTGLSTQDTEVLADTYKGPWVARPRARSCVSVRRRADCAGLQRTLAAGAAAGATLRTRSGCIQLAFR